MKTILLKFSGPLQAWGSPSNFEVRKTDNYPTKSAIIGLLAASLGYRRDEDDKIIKLNEIDFMVRIDQPGIILKDYHIAKKYSNKKELDYKKTSIERTYVTNRYYLEDAVFVVAISHSSDDFVEEIYGALLNPYFQGFMGRRSLPLNNDFILGLIDKTPKDALETLSWQAHDWYRKKFKDNLKNKLEVYSDIGLINSEFSTKARKDRVISFSQKNRKFGYRFETKTFIEVENDYFEKQHNIFEELEG